MQHHPSVISPQVQQLLRSAGGLHLPWHNAVAAAAAMPSSGHHGSYNIHMMPVVPTHDTVAAASAHLLANDMCGKPKHERAAKSSKSGAKKSSSSQKLVAQPDDSKQNSPESVSDLKGELPDFIETNCHWKHCNMEFQTQAVLVQVRLSRVVIVRVRITAPISRFEHFGTIY